MKLDTIIPTLHTPIVHRDKLRVVGHVTNYSNIMVHVKGMSLFILRNCEINVIQTSEISLFYGTLQWVSPKSSTLYIH